MSSIYSDFVYSVIKSPFIAVVVIIAGLSPFVAAPAANGQEDSDAKVAQESTNGESSLESLLQQWKDLDSQMAGKEAEFNSAKDTEKQQEIRVQYTELVEKATDLVARIRTEAKKTFDANPDDEATAKLLVGIIMNDAQMGRDNEAIKLGDVLIDAGVDGTLFEKGARADRLSVDSKELLEELLLRSRQSKQDDLPQVKIVTSKGEIVIELFEEEAPNTVANFISLVDDKFYDGLKFHRVIEGFVAQAGDPNGDGSGGPGYTIACECFTPDARGHFFGSLSMAHAGKDTGGSQFFLCLDRTGGLDGRHTVFGRVIEGIEVLDKLLRNATMSAAIPNAETDVINSMQVLRKRDHDYVPIRIADDSKGNEPEKPPFQPETIQNAASAGGNVVDQDMNDDGTTEARPADGGMENEDLNDGDAAVDDGDAPENPSESESGSAGEGG